MRSARHSTEHFVTHSPFSSEYPSIFILGYNLLQSNRKRQAPSLQQLSEPLQWTLRDTIRTGPTPSRPSATSRRPVIGGRTPHPRRTRAEEGLSSCRDSYRHIPRSLRRRVLRYPLQVLRHLAWPSPYCDRLGTLLCCVRRQNNDAANFTSCCGLRLDSPRFDAGISTNTAGFTTEGLGASSDWTRTGKLSRPCRSVTSC